jgi:trk system potassium uptake protein TrkH
MRLNRLISSPVRVSVASFAGVILTGTALLTLPAASTAAPIGLVDALFTATSACCVTGLAVVDTGKAFTLFGQLVVLALIQVGGLGILTLSNVFLLLAGGRVSLTGQVVIQDMFTHGGDRQLARLILSVFVLTFAIEAAGSFFLFLRFSQEHPPLQALYLSVFHAVSAFCNAGFSLFSNNLTDYRSDVLVNVTMYALIVTGGLGFLVLTELTRRFPHSRRSWLRLSLHSKVVLVTTGILILAGALLLLAMERGHTLKGMPGQEKALAAFFQSITARTAGFNTLDLGQFSNGSLFMMIMLMFIGAGSGSCAGGVKVGTAATLSILAFSRLRGYEAPHMFRRTFSQTSVIRAMNVVLISIMVVAVATLLLQLTELSGVSYAESRGKFLEILFEVVSAFGTVGLSTGLTGSLSPAGKIVISLTMFIGRLGPLAVALAVSRQRTVRFRYAEETIMIG